MQGEDSFRPAPQRALVADFERILTSTDACLTRQYQALLATEDVTIDFTPEGIERLAGIAYAVNETTENIGARRLYTVMEKLLEENNEARISLGQISNGPFQSRGFGDVVRRFVCDRYQLTGDDW